MENFQKNDFYKLIKRIDTVKNDSIQLPKEEVMSLFNQLVNYTKEISSLSLFSGNEDFEEIQTENIIYLLITYYQAELILMISDMNERKKNIKLSIKFYEEYFKILRTYQLITKEDIEKFKALTGEITEAEELGKENSNKYIPNSSKSKLKPDMSKMTTERDEKIKAYKYKKNLIDKLKLAESKSLDSTRDFVCDLISLTWVNLLETLASLRSELESLSFLDNMKQSGKYSEFSKPIEKSGKLEVLKINQDNINKLDPNNKLLNGVQFGCSNQCSNLNTLVEKRLNYKEEVFQNRNMPTMTLDDFADKQIVLMEEQKQMEEESKQRQVDEDNLSDHDEEVDDRRKKEKRAWDDWKDLNERGGGNKMGK